MISFWPQVECPIHHEDQAGADLRVLEPGAVEAADRGEDDVVEVALAAAVALHRVEAELERGDALGAVGAADGAVDRPLDRERGGLDQLGPVVDRVERVEVVDPAGVGDGNERVELPVVLDRQGDPLLVRETPEDLRGDRAAEVGVELGEALGGGEHLQTLGNGSLHERLQLGEEARGSIVCGTGASRQRTFAPAAWTRCVARRRPNSAG